MGVVCRCLSLETCSTSCGATLRLHPLPHPHHTLMIHGCRRHSRTRCGFHGNVMVTMVLVQVSAEWHVSMTPVNFEPLLKCEGLVGMS